MFLQGAAGRAAVVLAGLSICLYGGGAMAEITQFPAPAGDPDVDADVRLVVYSTTDLAQARPIVAGFQERYPAVAVEYHDLQSLDLYNRIIEESDGPGKTADFAFSSAMDLQVKLVNDGYASRQSPPSARSMPRWALWQNSAFGVTYEPVVTVYYKPYFEGREPPATRADMMRLLDAEGEALFGKVTTYDIERSGYGYFLLARDQEHSDEIWKLISMMGRQNVRLHSTSAAIIDRVSQGRLILGYNVIGSYAMSMAERRPTLGIIMPEDYTIVTSRVAFVPRAARSSRLGALFLEYLLSPEGQRILARRAGLGAANPAVEGPGSANALRKLLGARMRPVRVGPGLLVYLDQVKRSKLLERWNDALTRH